MKLNTQSLPNKDGWAAAGVKLPLTNTSLIFEKTKQFPVWLHFGAGNIFRGFVAVLMQRLLNEGHTDKGIIAAESFDYQIIDKIYTPHDNLTLNVTLNPDATTDLEIIASVAETIKADANDEIAMSRLREIFISPGLQMVSFTITEKGYALKGADGNVLPRVKSDMEEGPSRPRYTLSIVAAMLYERYKAGQHPLAVVSMDNCSRNGEKVKEGVTAIASAWVKNGFAEESFISYLDDESKISFPWSMIDKITPRPADTVLKALTDIGIEGMEAIITDKMTFIAPFVNAERPEYLVIEDSFPNGRPPLEKAGVYMTDRNTVNNVERMKVTTCLNPLHTAMSMYGCLLGYNLISEEMKDTDITALIKRLGYTESLPVVTDPGILSPKDFIDEVINERLPNPFMPDAPQRIATDTSQKVGIRFGETIKSYINKGLDLRRLTAVSLAIAGWLRYLLAVDDTGGDMEVSPDPMKEELQTKLDTIVWNDPKSYSGQARYILANEAIFGTDLTKTILADKIEAMFVEQLSGAGAVRACLKKHLS